MRSLHYVFLEMEEIFAGHVSLMPGMVDPPDRRHLFSTLNCLVITTITVDLLTLLVLFPESKKW